MREIGRVLHRARSGRLIIVLSSKVDAGATLLDEKGRKAARVVELIGPVARPYASAVPSSEREGTKGQILFLG